MPDVTGGDSPSGAATVVRARGDRLRHSWAPSPRLRYRRSGVSVINDPAFMRTRGTPSTLFSRRFVGTSTRRAGNTRPTGGSHRRWLAPHLRGHGLVPSHRKGVIAMPTVKESVEVDVPVRVAYDQW